MIECEIMRVISQFTSGYVCQGRNKLFLPVITAIIIGVVSGGYQVSCSSTKHGKCM